MDDLTIIANEVRSCRRCELSGTRKNAVPGEGPASAEVMFIGEGPGFHEDQQGRPFVGPAGEFLNQLLTSAGLNRNDVFIANVVKCRPPGNRDPLPEEISACSGYLDRQIEAINPKVIVTLGRYSMARYFPRDKISAIHGRARRLDGRVVVAMYHPAAALHQPALREAIEDDFRRLPQILADALKQAELARKTSKPEDDGAEQLSLF